MAPDCLEWLSADGLRFPMVDSGEYDELFTTTTTFSLNNAALLRGGVAVWRWALAAISLDIPYTVNLSHFLQYSTVNPV